MDLKYGPGNQLLNPKSPQQEFELSNKKYVDDSVYEHASDDVKHLSVSRSDWLNSILVTAAEVNYLSGVSSNIQTQLGQKLDLSGGSMTGNLSLFGNPSSLLHAVNKNYADTELAKKLNLNGGTMTGVLVLAGDPTSPMEASTKKYVDDHISSHSTDNTVHVTSTQKTWLNEITASSTQVNYLNGVTSSIQTQLNNRLQLSGGTLTGPLVLSGAPTLDLHPATKKYTDDNLNLKLNLSGGTMLGLLTLSGAPTLDLHASTKKYVDDSVVAHASSTTLHLTPDKNTWLDSITATASEVNQLSGITGNVQSLLNAKLDKTGGTLNGNLTAVAGVALFVSKVPEDPNELTNKAYVDAKVEGKKWRNPIISSQLVGYEENIPPLYPAEGDTYIIGPSPVGAWGGKPGYAVTRKEGAWVFLQDRRVAVGDRFGVRLLSGSALGGLIGFEKSLLTITTAVIGAYEFSQDPIGPGSTALVFDPDALDFGVTYSFTDEGNWVVTNTSVNITPAGGLYLNGRQLNIGQGQGVVVTPGKIDLNIDTNSGLGFDVSDKLKIVLDSTTLVASATGLKLNDTLKAVIDKAMTKDGINTVTGEINIASAGKLTALFTPTQNQDVITKGYADNINSTLSGQITTISNIVNVLNTDPVTMGYVNTELDKKLSKTGGTMTGALTLSADPANNLEAATKQYVDGGLNAHASNTDIHVTSTQKTWLSSITATAAEVNYLSGVTSSLQSQLTDKLSKTGGTMTGAITLSGLPTQDGHAANKKYVDDGLATKLSLSGGTMTGLLTLSDTPTNNAHAANKLYVDSTVQTHANSTALHLTPTQDAWLDAVSATAVEVNRLSGVTSNVQTQLNDRLLLSGGTLSGMLTLYADPTLANHASTKNYVDTVATGKLSLSGGTMTGYLKLAGDPVAVDDAVALGYLNTRITAANTYTDNQVATKLDKAGGTLTGFLTLHADPTSNNHASTKKYVDDSVTALSNSVSTSINSLQNRATNLETSVGILTADPVTKTYTDNQIATKLNTSGGILSGFLTLHADPTSPMHAVTKQYVDSTALGLSVKTAVRLATTIPLFATYNNGSFGVNATLTATSNGALVVDGKNANLNDRILVKMQSFSKENGDYVVVQVGDAGNPFILRRAVTMDETSEVPGSYFNVTDGNTLKGTGWVLTVADPTTFTLGTDAINANQFFGPGAYSAGTGMTLGADGKTFNINTVSQSRITVSADNIDLAISGVVGGTYTKITVDAYGRATFGENPTTLAGYGITDAQALNSKLTSISNISTKGLLVIDNANNPTTRTFAVTGIGLAINDNGTGSAATALTITSNATSSNTADTIVSRDASGNFVANNITASLTGNATTATTLQNSRNFNIAGDVVATAQPFNGSANVTLTANLIDVVTAGTYRSVTTDSKGRVVAGTNPTTLAGYGITDAQGLNAKLTSISAIATRGIMVIDSSDTAKVRRLTVSGVGLTMNDDGTGAAGSNLVITSSATSANTPSTPVSRNASGDFSANNITANLTGNASTATKLASTKNFSITGDITAPAIAYDHSGNVALAATLSNTGVAAGTYNSVTVDAKGRVTGATNPTTLAGYGITDGVTTDTLTTEINALKAQILELHNYILSRV